MSINVTTLLTRSGSEIAGQNEICTALQTTLGTRVNTIAALYQSTDQQVIDNLYTNRDSARGSMSGWLGNLQSLMETTWIDMAIDNTPPGINPQTLDDALAMVIDQLNVAGQTLQRAVTSSSVTAHSGNVGNGTIVVSLTDGIDGKPMDMVFAETLTAICTSDGYQNGGATAGQEPFGITGQVSVDSLAVNWPQGSGAATSTNAQNPAALNQVITDGSFESWGGTGNNTPTYWTIATATPGTTLLRGSSPYIGSFNLQFVGNGAELTCLRQPLTLSNFTPGGEYIFAIRAKTDGSVAAGVARFALVDQSNAIITDQAGNNNSVSQTISALTSSYTVISGAFRMPLVMTMTEIQMEIALTTALTNTEVLNMDSICIIPAARLYNGGPLIGILSGSTPFAKNDSFQIAIANNLGVTSFVRTLDRNFGLRDSGRKFQTALSPTYSDSLIA